MIENKGSLGEKERQEKPRGAKLLKIIGLPQRHRGRRASRALNWRIGTPHPGVFA
jgi:hypothetical protein